MDEFCRGFTSRRANFASLLSTFTAQWLTLNLHVNVDRKYSLLHVNVGNDHPKTVLK